MKKRSFSLNSNRWFWCVVTLLVVIAQLAASPAQPARAARQNGGIPPGHSDRILRLKFVEGTLTDDLGALLPEEAWQVIQKIDPLFTQPKSTLKELKSKGDERRKKEKGDGVELLPDLSLWYEVLLVQGSDPEAAIGLLSGLPAVDEVGTAPLLTDPPTADFTALQGYLEAATSGVDARYAWTLPGGTGAGITIYDIEYGWVQDHEDLSKARGVSQLLNPGDTALRSSTDHGTAVLGELIADNDGKGVTGIAYGANIKLAPANTANLGWNPANAILLSVADGVPGDVILLEQQTYVCNLNMLGPSEWDTPVFQAIQTATANGLIVVEAAGNGGVNLDRSECLGKFNRSTRDSGAILVGAGKPPTSGFDRQRESSATWGSSYGSRVDVQGWGSGVMTAGYGDYYGFDEWLDAQYFYTNTFSGTSSASPMVAGPAAILQAIAILRNGAPLSPLQVRDLLVQTGSSQLGNTAEHIGPRPNLRQAIANLPQSAATLTVNLGGSGNDGVCGITNCTLREAIQAANNDGLTTLIELAAGQTYSLDVVDNTDTTYGANALPVITSPIIIEANGAIIERSSASGTPEFRLFQVSGAGSLTLNQVTLRGGMLTGQDGGALFNQGYVNINDSTLSGSNSANGGALANLGTLNLVNSTVWNNSATGSGGAIKSSGTLQVLGSTLAGNRAASGGTLAFSGNTIVKNSLMVTGGQSSGANCSGALTLGSASNQADDSSCGTSTTVKTTAQINLATALADNGGPTQTLALLNGSTAIDMGNATACKASKVKNTDQRSYNRFVDGNNNGVKECDLGAFEYGSAPLPPAPPEADSTPPATRILLNPASPHGSNGWYRSAPLINVASRDAAGVIEIRCALDPVDTPNTYTDLPEEACSFTSGALVTADGPHMLYAAAMDLYGNQGVPVSVSFQIDTTLPVITCPSDDSFLLNSGEQMVGPAAVDAGVSGLDEAASLLSGVISTAVVGPQTMAFNATDLAGNSASQTCSFNVIYNFDGFYPPLNPVPALNQVLAGSALPVKFSLGGEQGLAILASAPTVQPVNCSTLVPTGAAVQVKTIGESGLSFDLLTGWYSFVWKTDKAYRRTCQSLTIQLIDGTQHFVNVRFR